MKTKQLTRPFELKELTDDGTFEGYGSVFNVMDSYRDIILPGAFSASLKEHAKRKSAPKLLWQHRSDEPIGVYEEMREDDHGLFVRGRLLTRQNVPTADKAYSLLKAGAVNGLSIGFNIPKGGEEFDEDENVCKISEIDLWETSIVTFPANRDAQITEVRADYVRGMTKRELEAYLRDAAGLSRSQAEALVSGGYSALTQGDPDGVGDVIKSANYIINTLTGDTPNE